MKTILAISGSLRSESKNSIILRHIKKELENRVHIEIFESIGNLPHFNPDIEFLENADVLKYRMALKTADAVLISTPEYAHGIPGSLKNALDWVVGSGELMDKKVGLLFTSSSEALFVQEQIIEVLKTMSAKTDKEMSVKISGVALTPDIENLIAKLIS